MNFGDPGWPRAGRYVIASALRPGVDAAKFQEAEDGKREMIPPGKVLTEVL